MEWAIEAERDVDPVRAAWQTKILVYGLVTGKTTPSVRRSRNPG
jgi:hypothetical protein